MQSTQESLVTLLTTLLALLGSLEELRGAEPISAIERGTALTASSTDDTRTIEERIGDATVNIYCSVKIGKKTYTTTGSGVFIDPKGVILTNAHVAEFLLLSDTKGASTRCSIRTGSPAREQYIATLLYIPPVWVYKNASELSEKEPTGTGADDFALLYATDTTDKSVLPNTFPYLPIDTAPFKVFDLVESVFVAGYPAEHLGPSSIQKKLPAVIADSVVIKLRTFSHEAKGADVLTIAPSKAGSAGVSGGPIVRETGKVLGLIVTKGSPQSDGEESLRAITLSYIDRMITSETKLSLHDMLSGDLNARAAFFQKALVPFLGSIVFEVLK